jgi:hypothetical protein
VHNRFSDRIGVTKPLEVFQLSDINEPLRNSLWNLVLSCLSAKKGPHTFWRPITETLAVDFFKVPLDSVPNGYASDARGWLRALYFKLLWYEVYNLVEFIVRVAPAQEGFPFARSALIVLANAILEREVSGYRFVQGVLAPVSNQAEVAAIEEAAGHSAALGLNGVHMHIRTAVTLLAQKPTPDYRNSIKESISAVEAAAKVISGREKAELGSALDSLEMHGALKRGLTSIYGYASDSDGIRHALMDEPSVGLDDAKFMLVSCSAFANYLIAKAETAGLLDARRAVTARS